MSVGNKDGRRISLKKAMEFGDEQKSIGKQNKERIHRFMIDAYPEGKSVSELVNYTKCDRDTIYEHLRVLLRERKVEKIKVKGKHHRVEYRTTDTNQVSKEVKARIMGLMVNKMIYAIYRKPPILVKDITKENIAKNPVLTPQLVAAYMTNPSPLDELRKPGVEFYESMSRNDVTISHKFCHTKFGRAEKEEKHMFEFVNRVGAFIAYIFIESLEASNEKSNDDNTKTPITKLIIDNAIDLNEIFNDFCNLFEKQSAKEISKTFRRLYPTAGILEKYWSDRVQLSERFKKEQAKAQRDRRGKNTER